MTADTATFSEARVVTDRPARYGKQLAAHLGRRHGSEWDDASQHGSVELADGRAELSCEPGALLLRVTGAADAMERLEDVVGRHLVRFGTHDELVVTWVREGGQAGTEQRG